MAFSFNSRPKFSVQVTQTGEAYLCADNESLLAGMLRLFLKVVHEHAATAVKGVKPA